MIFLLLSYLIFWALSCICLSIEKHANKIFAKKLTTSASTKLGLIGYVTLLITLSLAIYLLGTGIGLVYFLATLSLAHFIIVMLVSYGPKYLLLLTGLLLANSKTN